MRRLAPDDPEPTGEELAALEVEWTAHNGGVRPRVRVLEQARIPRAVGVAGVGGPAGVTP